MGRRSTPLGTLLVAWWLDYFSCGKDASEDGRGADNSSSKSCSNMAQHTRSLCLRFAQVVECSVNFLEASFKVCWKPVTACGLLLQDMVMWAVKNELMCFMLYITTCAVLRWTLMTILWATRQALLLPPLGDTAMDRDLKALYRELELTPAITLPDLCQVTAWVASALSTLGQVCFVLAAPLLLAAPLWIPFILAIGLTCFATAAVLRAVLQGSTNLTHWLQKEVGLEHYSASGRGCRKRFNGRTSPMDTGAQRCRSPGHNTPIPLRGSLVGQAQPVNHPLATTTTTASMDTPSAGITPQPSTNPVTDTSNSSTCSQPYSNALPTPAAANGTHSSNSSSSSGSGKRSSNHGMGSEVAAAACAPCGALECPVASGVQAVTDAMPPGGTISAPVTPTCCDEPADGAIPSLKYGSHGDQNRSAKPDGMEDRHVANDITASLAAEGIQRAGLFAVFDGHGGQDAAEHLQKTFADHVLAAGPEMLVAEPKAALANAVERCEDELVDKWQSDRGATSGSTLCAAMLLDEKLHIVNVGDSRAVLFSGEDVTQLTADHKASCPKERERIMALDRDAEITPSGYLYGELALSRGLGPAHLKVDSSKRGYTAEAEYTCRELAATDDFLVVASDGFFDVQPGKQFVGTARKAFSEGKTAGEVAKLLVERAIKMESQDNVTVVVVLLHGRPITVQKSNSRLFSRSAVPVEV